MKPSVRNLLFFFILYSNNFWTQEPIYSYFGDKSSINGNPAFMGNDYCPKLTTSTVFSHSNANLFSNQTVALSGNIKSTIHAAGILIEGNKIGTKNQYEKYSGLYSYRLAISRNLGVKLAGQVNYFNQNGSLEEMLDANLLDLNTSEQPIKTRRNDYLSFDLGMLLYTNKFFISARIANLNTPSEVTIYNKKISKPIRTTFIVSYMNLQGPSLKILPTLSFDYSGKRYFNDSLQKSFLSSSNNVQFNTRVEFKGVFIFGLGYRNVFKAYNNYNVIIGFKRAKFEVIYNFGIAKPRNEIMNFHQLNLAYLFSCKKRSLPFRGVPDF